MKQYSLLIFFAILFICSSTNLRSSDISLIENLRKTDFGTTLLKSIQVQLKSKATHPIDSILDLVNKIKTQIEEEQTEKQEEYTLEKDECVSSQTDFEVSIATNQETINDNNKEVVLLTGQLDSYETDLESAETLRQSKEDQIDSLDAIREEESQRYETEKTELTELIAALREGKTILQQLLVSGTSTGSFFEKNQILNKPNTNDFKRVVSLLQTKKNGYMKLATLLLESVMKQDGDVDQDMLNNVLDLIESLINQLLDNLQTKSETEEARIDTYETEKNNLESSLTLVQSNIASIESTINVINDQLLNLNQDNIDLENKIESLETDKTAKEQECTDYYHTYLTESQNRSNELDILDKIIEIFETRFDLVDEYISELTL